MKKVEEIEFDDDDDKNNETFFENHSNLSKLPISSSPFVIEETLDDDYLKEGMNAYAQAFELPTSKISEPSQYFMWRNSYSTPNNKVEEDKNISKTNNLVTPKTNNLVTPASFVAPTLSQGTSRNMMKTSLNINTNYFDDEPAAFTTTENLSSDFVPSSLLKHQPQQTFSVHAPTTNDSLQQSWVASSNLFKAECIGPAVSDESYGYQQYPVRSPSNCPQQQQSQYSMRSPTQKLTLKEMQMESMASADGYIYKVHFKRAPRHFVLSSYASRSILPGDYVKVEADRGEDLGAVVAKIPVNDFHEFMPTAGYRGRGFSSGSTEKKDVLRLATVDECRQLIEKFEDEARCLETIREKVLLRRLPMSIIDCEYQFDHHKLVFFFTADKRVDFRDLVSDLFSLYKTRIWMQQVDMKTIPDDEILGSNSAESQAYSSDFKTSIMCNRVPKFRIPVKFFHAFVDGNGQQRSHFDKDLNESKTSSFSSYQKPTSSDAFNLEAFSNVFNDKDEEKEEQPFGMNSSY